MLDGARVSVIVPAYHEERLIARTLRGIPGFVDAIYVVDDGSSDRTLAEARASSDARVRCLAHPHNLGVGAAIVTGYRAALADGHDVLAVMAGDDQMDPGDLERLVRAVSNGAAYAKGNRFVHASAGRMPILRRLGGELLSALTRRATGLALGDSQCGYTALARDAAEALPLGELWPRYGYPNDLLGMLAARGLKVAERPVRAVYADEVSGIRAWHVLTVSYVILRRLLRERGRRAVRMRRPSLA